MLPAGSSCLPFFKIHLKVLYLAFSLGIVFLYQKGVSSPAEPCFQNYHFSIIWENLLFLILSCYCIFIITQRCCILYYYITLYYIILAHTYFNENSICTQKSLSIEDCQSDCLETPSLHSVQPPWMFLSSSPSTSCLSLCFLLQWQMSLSTASAGPFPPSSCSCPSILQPLNSAAVQQMGTLLIFLFLCNDCFVDIDQRWVSNQHCTITLSA